MRCVGQGPSKEVRDARDRAQQIRVAEDFANILDNEEDVLMEAEEAINPSHYVPKKGSHRAPPPKRKISNSQHGGKRGKVQKKTQKVDEGKLEEQCRLATRIVGGGVTPDPTINIIKNPPMIMKVTWQIHRCHGCKKDISEEDKVAPNDMVFWRNDVVGYLNPTLNKWCQSGQFLYFHLNMNCLRRHEGTIEVRYIGCNDDQFVNLTEENMEHLNNMGFLKPIIRKKYN